MASHTRQQSQQAYLIDRGGDDDESPDEAATCSTPPRAQGGEIALTDLTNVDERTRAILPMHVRQHSIGTAQLPPSLSGGGMTVPTAAHSDMDSESFMAKAEQIPIMDTPRTTLTCHK